jgi:hypothetical protein
MEGGCGCGSMMNGAGMMGGKRGKPLEKDTKKVLYEKAKKYAVKGRSTMNKTELAAAVRKAQKDLGDKLSKRRR